MAWKGARVGLPILESGRDRRGMSGQRTMGT